MIARTAVLGTNASEGVYRLSTPFDILIPISTQNCRNGLLLTECKDWHRQERHRWSSATSVSTQSSSRVMIVQVRRWENRKWTENYSDTE